MKLFCHSLSSEFHQRLLPPMLLEGSSQVLHLEATLQELQRYDFHVELDCLGLELAQVFEQHPLLPGAILLEQGQFAGMLSRRQLLEYLIRPHGTDFFLKEPLRVLYSYARSALLIVPSTTPIVLAAQQALRRSPELLSEPIVVQTAPHTYHLLDIHSLNIAYWQIRGVETQVRYERTQAQLIQSEKMASLGRLVDGVAHEILDPVSFIWGNLSHVSTYTDSLLKLLSAYETRLGRLPAELVRLRDDLEIDYLREDLPRTIESIRTGAERVSKLASSLQNFCHIDEVYPKPTDLHELIDSILLLLKSRLTSEIRVVKRYGQLPPVLCFAGQLYQVFMNILTHGVDALIEQAVSQQLEQDFQASRQRVLTTTHAAQPTIAITTEIRTVIVGSKSSRWVSICIANNGSGLTPEDQTRIWESFSVKKRAEKETSLAVSYQIITAKHGGKFEMRSRHAVSESCNAASGALCSPSEDSMAEQFVTGTEFELLLPLV